jgi:glycosyltransferase involved in cell wall biosynthesis
MINAVANLKMMYEQMHMVNGEKMEPVSSRAKRQVALLSLCIPTYNRAAKLERMMGWLQGQLKGVESEVEICISSNGSTDGTDGVAAKWAKRLPISYRKNRRNRGYDFNMLSAIRMAKGRYCWCFGDDDRPEEGAVKAVLADIKSLGSEEAGAIYINVSYNSGFLNGRKYSDLPDGPFKVYSVAEAAYAPLSMLHLGLICLNRKVAGEVIGKKIYIEGDRVCKREGNPDMLHLWVQVYLFLECIRIAGSFGIEPKSMVRLVSDGESTTSYEKKMYLDMACFNYEYDIRKNYPEFRGSFNPPRVMGHLLKMAMVCENPSLEAAHLATTRVFVKLLGMDGRKNDIWLVHALEAVRRLPLMRRAIPVAYRAFLSMRGKGNALRNQGEASPEVMESLRFMTEYTMGKFGG